MYRDHTKVVQIGNKKIGGGNPILIQSMTNTKTEDVEATVRQILELEAAGCDIIRCAVPTMEAAQALKEIKKQIHLYLDRRSNTTPFALKDVAKYTSVDSSSCKFTRSSSSVFPPIFSSMSVLFLSMIRSVL